MSTQDFSSLAKISNPVAAITCILVANYGFLSAAFFARKYFGPYEFYAAVGLVEVVTYAACSLISGTSTILSLSRPKGQKEG
jgi:hypothetical protein